MESRLRQLVMKLEYVEALTLAHPFVKGFEQTLHCIDENEVRAAAQGDITDTVKKRTKEEIEGKEGASTVYSTTFYIGLAIEPKPGTKALELFILHSVTQLLPIFANLAGATGARKLDISYPTTEFTKMVKMWDKYEEAKMGIVVRHIKRSVLL